MHTMDQDKYVGIWITADGHIRHELLSGGRYRLSVDHIEYLDDTGFNREQKKDVSVEIKPNPERLLSRRKI
jgi:hypothetical protein